jgi:hypothetical protein
MGMRTTPSTPDAKDNRFRFTIFREHAGSQDLIAG